MFGLMNLFARALGGWASDKAAVKWGIAGRFRVLMVTTMGTGTYLPACLTSPNPLRNSRGCIRRIHHTAGLAIGHLSEMLVGFQVSHPGRSAQVPGHLTLGPPGVTSPTLVTTQDE